MRSIQIAGITGIALASLLLAVRANVATPGAAYAASSESEFPEARIAICSAIAITDELMSSDRFAPAIDANADKLREELLRPLVEEGRALERELQDAGPNDPANKERQQRLIELREIILPQRQQRCGVLQEQFIAEKTIEAYQMVASSARDIATDLGYNYLFVTDADRALDEMRGAPMAAVQQAILGRPALLFPESVDISDDVRDDLNL